MYCRSAVDLRRRVRPTVGPADTTVLQAFHDAEISVPLNADTVAISRDIKCQLERDIGDRLLKMAWERPAPRSDSALEDRLAHVLVTNWGPLPRLEQPPKLCIVDRLKGWLDNEYVSWMGVHPIYILGTYDNRLKVLSMYPASEFSDDEASIISDRISTRLREVPRLLRG